MSFRDPFEREFFEGGEWNPPGGLQFDRRDFLKIFGGGLFVGLASASAWTQEEGGSFVLQEPPKDVGAWLHIAADGGVRVFTGKAEVGQNIRTSLAQLVADELRVPFASSRNGDGRYGSHTLGHGDIRQPLDTHHGPATAHHGRGRAPDAA